MVTLVEQYSADEQFEGMLFLDGFDPAFVGIGWRFNDGPVAVYNRTKIIEMLMDEGSTREDAEEHFEFNIIGGWVGDFTPIFMVFSEQLIESEVWDCQP